MIKLFLAVLLTFSLEAREVIDIVGECSINWSSGLITCNGESAEGQSTYRAKRAATLVAQRNLLEVVKGVQIQSETTIAEGMRESDVIMSRVSGVVKGAQVISNRYNRSTRSSLATVQLRMGKDLLSALLSDPTKLSWNETVQKLWSDFSFISSAHASSVYMPNEKKTLQKIVEDLRAQGNTDGTTYLQNLLHKMDESSHSGILIDISSVNDFKKAMIVKLVDEDGKEIYPANLVSKRTLMKRNTSVGYMFGLDDARKNKRVFSTPLELKVANVYKNKKSNIVLSSEQIKMLHSLDKTILKGAKIILVLDD